MMYFGNLCIVVVLYRMYGSCDVVLFKQYAHAFGVGCRLSNNCLLIVNILVE